MKAADLRKRLEAISAAITGTFTARFAKLTDAEKAMYRTWKGRCRTYFDQHVGGEAYERQLEGERPPTLPRTLLGKLFDPIPVITEAMSVDDVAEIYRRMALGD